MSKDYKYRAVEPRKSKAEASGLLWFVSGTLLGAFFIGLAWLKFNPDLLTGKTTTTQAAIQQKAQTPPKPQESAAPAPSTVTFEFDKILRNTKVEPTARDSTTQAKPTLPPVALPPKPTAALATPELQPQTHAVDSTNTRSQAVAEPTPLAAPAETPKPKTRAEKHHKHATVAAESKSNTKRKPKRSETYAETHDNDDEEHSHRHKAAKHNTTQRAEHVAVKEHAAKPRLKPKKAVSPPSGDNTAARSKTTHEKSSKKPLVLQLGVFKSGDDARQMRARMALLGVETEVQNITTKDHKTIHRLRTSPYGNKSELEEARHLLDKHKVKSVVVE